MVFDAYQRFLCLGLATSVHSDSHVLAAVVANARPGNVFLGISCSGRTRDLVEGLESAGRRGASRIVISSDGSSPAAAVADIFLNSAVRRSPVAHDPIGTRISQLAIIEMLCVAVALQIPERLARSAELLKREIAKKRLPRASVKSRKQRA